MATQKFPMGEAIEFGWNITKNNLGFFTGLLTIAGLIFIVPIKRIPSSIGFTRLSESIRRVFP